MDTQLIAQLRAFNVDDTVECRPCDYKYLCGGGCLAITYKMHGNFSQTKNFYCRYRIHEHIERMWRETVSEVKSVAKIFRRDVDGKPFTEKEREYFAKGFLNEKEFPPPVQKKFVDQIPKNKMYFYTAKPTTRYLLVFRIKEDTTTDKPPYPVDVFSIKGEFLGEVNIHKLPLLVTDNYMYFEEGDENNEDDLVLLSKYSYELTKSPLPPINP